MIWTDQQDWSLETIFSGIFYCNPRNQHNTCHWWKFSLFYAPETEKNWILIYEFLYEFFFTKIWEEDIGNIAEATLDVLRPVFEDRINSRRADFVWLPRICDLILLDYYLWGAVKYKCYPDKPEKPLVKYSWTQSIMCLKIRSIVYATAWPAEAAMEWNEIIFHY